MNIAYNMDCMEGMKQFPDKYFDLAVVDPIYGDVTQGGYITGKSKGGVAAHPAYNMEMWKQPKTGSDYFDELFRVSKNQIIFGGNYFMKEIARDSQCWIVWDKCHPEGVKFAEAELAWTSFNSRTRIFHFLWNGMCQGTPGNGTKMQGNKSRNEVRIHIAQKPVPLYAWIFQNFAMKGNKILDTHLGSGSSRIAAWDAGLDFTGYEIDKDYFDKQEQRFQNHIAQTSLFVGLKDDIEKEKLEVSCHSEDWIN